jgi:hypothetical protein
MQSLGGCFSFFKLSILGCLCVCVCLCMYVACPMAAVAAVVVLCCYEHCTYCSRV